MGQSFQSLRWENSSSVSRQASVKANSGAQNICMLYLGFAHCAYIKQSPASDPFESARISFDQFKALLLKCNAFEHTGA